MTGPSTHPPDFPLTVGGQTPAAAPALSCQWCGRDGARPVVLSCGHQSPAGVFVGRRTANACVGCLESMPDLQAADRAPWAAVELVRADLKVRLRQLRQSMRAAQQTLLAAPPVITQPKGPHDTEH